MPFKTSETSQFGYVGLPSKLFGSPGPDNPLVLVPPLWWNTLILTSPAPVRSALLATGRFYSISDVSDNPAARMLELMLLRLNATEAALTGIGFRPLRRQVVILSGANPFGLHRHVTNAICTGAFASPIPLCWPIIPIMILLGRRPSNIQLILCIAQTALLQALRQWCAQDGRPSRTGAGTPNPYFYTNR